MVSTVLVTGASGFLGRAVLQAFETAGWKAVGVGFTRANPPALLKVDLLSQNGIESLLEKVKPQVIVHCAANRSPQLCNADPEAARALNVGASRILARASAHRSILLIYISTDYVFDGTPGMAPYEANAPTCPPNLYGQTKLEGEKAILEQTKTTGLGVVLRVPVLYGKAETHNESAINVLLDCVWEAQDKESTKVFMDDFAQRYPTNTEDVGRVCKDLAMKYLDAGPNRLTMPNVLHFSSEDKFTKFEICQFLADIMGLPLDGMVGTKEGGDPNVPRPYDAHLSTKSLKELGINVMTQDFKGWWRREVRAFRG